MVSIPAEGHHGMDSIPLLAARHYAGLVLSQFIALSLVGLLGNPLFVVILVSRDGVVFVGYNMLGQQTRKSINRTWLLNGTYVGERKGVP